MTRRSASLSSPGGALRRIIDLLNGEIDPVGLVDADDLDLDLLTLLQIIADLIDIGIGDLGDVHQSGAALRQRHKRTKLRDSRYLTVQNGPNTKLHTD